MLILEGRDIILKHYGDVKNIIGKFKCNGKEIDADTTIVFDVFHKSEEITEDDFPGEKCLEKIFLCSTHVFCKCGRCHLVASEISADIQIQNIVADLSSQGKKITIPDYTTEGVLITHFVHNSRPD